MGVFEISSLRRKRILEWRVLAFLFILIVILITMSIRIYLKREEGSEGYDYFYFAHESLELVGENESSERVVLKNPAVIKTKHDDQFLAPIVFIAGFPRSGSKVVKELFEHYVKVKCNNQTKVFTELLALAPNWNESKREMIRLVEAGIDETLLLEILGGFTRDIVYGQSIKTQEMICVHEEDAYLYSRYLSQFFPTAKFIYVVRDGRAVVHSILTRLTIEERKLQTYSEGYTEWAQSMNILLNGCDYLGEEKCHRIRYEDLFVEPWETLESLFYFLEMMDILPDRTKAAVQNISIVFDYLAQREPIGQEALNQAAAIAPILEELGYDPKLYVAGNTAQDFDT